MMVSAQSFRWLLLVAVVISLAANFVDVLYPGTLPDRYAHHTGELLSRGLALTASFAAIGSMSLVASIVSTVGLALFRRWSRPLTVVSMVFQLASYLLTAYFVTSGLKFALCALANSFSGFIVALAYCSALSGKFAVRSIEATSVSAQ